MACDLRMLARGWEPLRRGEEVRDADEYERRTASWDPRLKDPLSRFCPEHDRPYVNMGRKSVCAECWLTRPAASREWTEARS